MIVIISWRLTRPACHCFAIHIQGLGYFVPTKKSLGRLMSILIVGSRGNKEFF